MPGAFNGFRQQALMRRADSADSPGQDLSTFRDEMTQKLSIFEIDIGDLFSAEFADSLAPNAESSRTWHSSSPLYRWGSGQARSLVKTLYRPDGGACSGSMPESSASSGSSELSGASGASGACLAPFLCLAAFIFSERLMSSSIRTEMNRIM